MLYRGLFDKERIAKCKKGAVIVNNAQGAIVDTQAVADACSCGHIAGIKVPILFVEFAYFQQPQKIFFLLNICRHIVLVTCFW